MRKKEVPAVISPEHFEAQKGFVASSAPELTASFHATLELAAGGFDGTRANGLVALAAGLVLPGK